MSRLWLRAIVPFSLCLTFFLGVCDVQAGPFAEFFRELRETLKNPDQRSHSHRTTTQTHRTQAATSDTAESAKTNGPPNERNTRTTARTSTNVTKSELKYGTPVPGRKGLVTSPFSSDAGYIDVRGFPPGTAVKDPVQRQNLSHAVNQKSAVSDQKSGKNRRLVGELTMMAQPEPLRSLIGLCYRRERESRPSSTPCPAIPASWNWTRPADVHPRVC